MLALAILYFNSELLSGTIVNLYINSPVVISGYFACFTKDRNE